MRVSMKGVLVLSGFALLAVACDEKDEDTGGELIEADDGDDGDDGEDCEGTPPTVVSVTCTNRGMLPDPETSVEMPAMNMNIHLDDEDGDLDQYRLELYLDDTIDGTVDTSDSPFGPLVGALEAEECAGFGAEINLTLYLQGGTPAYDTWYEWGLVVTDANGYVSDTFIVECGTPKEDGSDGPEGAR
jgi:hypothetical protein